MISSNGYVQKGGQSVEIFYALEGELDECLEHDGADIDERTKAGWFFWACHPGCLPDGPPFGPFETRRDAWLEVTDYLTSYP